LQQKFGDQSKRFSEQLAQLWDIPSAATNELASKRNEKMKNRRVHIVILILSYG
jgi:hypothetical protein